MSGADRLDTLLAHFKIGYAHGYLGQEPDDTAGWDDKLEAVYRLAYNTGSNDRL